MLRGADASTHGCYPDETGTQARDAGAAFAVEQGSEMA
jgi:hypothetical protein